MRFIRSSTPNPLFPGTEIKRSRKLHSDRAILSGPDCVQDFLELRCPENIGELKIFVHAIGWLRPVSPEPAKPGAQLRTLQEEDSFAKDEAHPIFGQSTGAYEESLDSGEGIT